MTKFLHTKGFTLIETMIAIGIILVATTGPLLVADRASVASDFAANQLTASALAQEGIEYVRWMRDDAYLNAYKLQKGGTITDASTYGWSHFISGTDAWSIASCVSYACSLDPTQNMGIGSSLQQCTASTPCGPLYIQKNNGGTYAAGIYTQSSGIVSNPNTKTPYTRTVQATSISATEEEITSTVTWSTHGTTHSVVLNDNLTAWQ